MHQGLSLLRFPHASQTPLASEPFQVWRLHNQLPWCEIYNDGLGYRMRFPGLADFIVHRDGVVECFPAAGIDETTQDHLYLNQVVPAVLNMMNRPTFHASCVAVDGHAIAFLGESGRGKSTLSTFLGRQGNALISDDGVELQITDTTCLAIPSQPAVRLWQDSSFMLLPDEAIALPSLSYTTKHRYASAGLMPHAQQPLPLRRAYFLGDGSASTIEIKPFTGHAAHLAWVKHSPMLDAHDKARLRSHFSQVSILVAMAISFTLDFPRDYQLLPEVADALRSHLNTQD